MQVPEAEKVRVLLQLLEQNLKSVDWVKDLDFKVFYHTLFPLGAVVAFVATRTITSDVRCVLFTTTIFVGLVAVGFLVRNHCRHIDLLRDDGNIKQALQLFDNNV